MKEKSKEKILSENIGTQGLVKIYQMFNSSASSSKLRGLVNCYFRDKKALGQVDMRVDI
jgi:hypothetical protein